MPSPRSRPGSGDTEFDEFDGVFSKDELDTLRNIFRELDTSGTGKLRMEDLQHFIMMHGGAMDSEQVLDQWRSIDISGDGYVDTEEFLHWMAKAQGLVAGHQAEVSRASARPQRKSTSGPRFSMWSTQESLFRRLQEDEEPHRRESEPVSDSMDMERHLIALDMENLRDQLENERRRRLDLEAELYNLAVARDADMGGAVPIAEYEKLRLAEQLAQERLEELTEESTECERSLKRPAEVDKSPDTRSSLLAAEKRKSTLRRQTLGLGAYPKLPAITEFPPRRYAQTSNMPIYPILLTESVSPGGARGTISQPPLQNLPSVQFEIDNAIQSGSDDSDSESDKHSQISLSFKKEVRKKKDSYSDEKDTDSLVLQESLKAEIHEVVSEVRAVQKVQDTAVDEVAMTLADKVLKLMREEPADVISASDVAKRAALMVAEQRKEAEEAAAELPLGAQMELADVRQTICSGLEDELADVQALLKSCVESSGSALHEQSDLCDRLAQQAKQLRHAVETLPPPFVSPVPPVDQINAVAESMAEQFADQLASIHSETSEVASAVVSAVSTLRSTLTMQAATPVPVEPALVHAPREDWFLDFYFDNLRLDYMNEAWFTKELRECLQKLGAEPAVLESLTVSQQPGASLLASICSTKAQIHALEQLPLFAKVTVMGDVARVMPGISEAQRLNQSVSAELQGLRSQLEELAAKQPAPVRYVEEFSDDVWTPGFDGLWAAVTCQDDMVIGFGSAGARCRAEHWLLENGVRSLWELVVFDGQESFLSALQLDPVRQRLALEWLTSKTAEVKNERVLEALISACNSRDRTKLDEALQLAEEANLQNDVQYEHAKAVLRRVWEEEFSQRAESLQAAYDAALPPGLHEVISYVLLISSPDGAEEEVQRLCDEEAYQSWVKWVPDDLSTAQANPEMGYLRCRSRLRKEVESRLSRTRLALHVTLIFLSSSPFAQCTQEKLVDIASHITSDVAQKSQRCLQIGICGFNHVEDCRRYLEEQACEQRRLHDVISNVELLRSELNEGSAGREEQQVETLQKRLGAELESVCVLRKWAEQAMSSVRLKHLEKELRHLESDKERGQLETKALDVQVWELSHKLDMCDGEEADMHETEEQISALKGRLEKIQNQQHGIEALQATNTKVSEYTRRHADASCRYADELIESVRSCIEAPLLVSANTTPPLPTMRSLDSADAAGEVAKVLGPTSAVRLGGAELEELLKREVLRARTRNVRLLPLMWASVHLHAKLGDPARDTRILDSIKLAVVEEASRSNVTIAEIAASSEDGFVCCDVRIGGDSSVLAAVEALHAHRWRAGGLRDVLEAAGAIDLQVAPKWPVERIRTEIQLVYGYRPDSSMIEAALLPTLDESADLYAAAWEKACWQAPSALKALVQMESMVLFEDHGSIAHRKGQLLPVSEGRDRGFAEVSLRQGACNLADLMSDAAAAHRQLKGRLLPGSSWSDADLNDMRAVPAGHVIRTWHSTSLDPAPCGAHHDPGLEREERVLSAARRMMRALDVDPQLDAVFNASSLDIVFESAECLKNAADWLIKNLDVVWLENQFRNPSCLGYRDLTVGVRWFVADGDVTNPPHRVHINEIRLSLKELHEKKREAGARLIAEGYSKLAKCGIKTKDLDGVWHLILHVLDCTNGRATAHAQRHLAYVTESASSVACRPEGSIAVLAKELVEEAAIQAMAAGVAADEVNRAKAQLSRVVASASSGPLQLSRQGALSIGAIAGEPGDSDASQQCKEDPSAMPCTGRSLPESVGEQVPNEGLGNDASIARVSDQSYKLAVQQLPTEINATAAGCASADSVERLAQCGDAQSFSGELLQLRYQIAGLKDHAERTEQLRNAVLQMLSSTAESRAGNLSTEMQEEVTAAGREIEVVQESARRMDSEANNCTVQSREPDQEHEPTAERKQSQQHASRRHPTCHTPLTDKSLMNLSAQPHDDKRQTSGIAAISKQRPQVDRWHRQRQGRWSRWLRESAEEPGSADLTAPPVVDEAEAKNEPENDSNAEEQVSREGDEGLVMWELLQRLRRQAPHWEADQRERSTETRLHGRQEGDAMRHPHEQQQEEAEEQDNQMPPCRRKARRATPVFQGDLTPDADDDNEEMLHPQFEEPQLSSSRGTDFESEGNMKALLKREERMRQEARLERVLERLEERLLVQEQGQVSREPGLLVSRLHEPAQALNPKAVQALAGTQSLPCRALPQLQESQSSLHHMHPQLQLPEPLRPHSIETPRLYDATSLGSPSSHSRQHHEVTFSAEHAARLGSSVSSPLPSPSTSSPAIRDARPRPQGAAPAIGQGGLPSLRPGVQCEQTVAAMVEPEAELTPRLINRFLERASWDTTARFGTGDSLLLDRSAAATA